jgi:hypothetical protein
MDFGQAERLMNRAELHAHVFLAARDGGVVALSGS